MDLLSQGQQGYFPLSIVTSGDHVANYIPPRQQRPPRKVCLQPQDRGLEILSRLNVCLSCWLLGQFLLTVPAPRTCLQPSLDSGELLSTYPQRVQTNCPPASGAAGSPALCTSGACLLPIHRLSSLAAHTRFWHFTKKAWEKKRLRAGEIAQLIKGLPCKHEVMDLEA